MTRERGSFFGESHGGRLLAGLLAVIAVALAIAALLPAPPQNEPRGPAVLQISPPPGSSFGAGLAIAPDGRRVIFTAAGADGVPRVWVRDVEALASRQMPGTDGATAVFWSPDGDQIGFVAGLRIVTVGAAGGLPVTVARSTPGSDITDGAWGDGAILVAGRADGSAIRRLPDSGGAVTPVTALDASREEALHATPSFLPDGRHFIYYRRSRRPEFTGLFVGSIDRAPAQQDATRLVDAEPGAVFATDSRSHDRLLYLSRGIWMSQPFDTRQHRLTGSATPVERARTGCAIEIISASRTNAVAYRAGGTVTLQGDARY